MVGSFGSAAPKLLQRNGKIGKISHVVMYYFQGVVCRTRSQRTVHKLISLQSPISDCQTKTAEHIEVTMEHKVKIGGIRCAKSSNTPLQFVNSDYYQNLNNWLGFSSRAPYEPAGSIGSVTGENFTSRCTQMARIG